MAQIVWSQPARDDLREIISYIRANSPAYAKSFALRLQQRIAHLETFPDAGRPVPEDSTGNYREIILGNYRVIYRHSVGTVTIVTIVHGARDFRI